MLRTPHWSAQALARRHLCVEQCVVRAGARMDSERLGLLVKNICIYVLEERVRTSTVPSSCPCTIAIRPMQWEDQGGGVLVDTRNHVYTGAGAEGPDAVSELLADARGERGAGALPFYGVRAGCGDVDVKA